jgi:hypothetical protein
MGAKWLDHKADHSPPFNAEVKNVCSLTSTLHIFTAQKSICHSASATWEIIYFLHLSLMSGSRISYVVFNLVSARSP